MCVCVCVCVCVILFSFYIKHQVAIQAILEFPVAGAAGRWIFLLTCFNYDLDFVHPDFTQDGEDGGLLHNEWALGFCPLSPVLLLQIYLSKYCLDSMIRVTNGVTWDFEKSN